MRLQVSLGVVREGFDMLFVVKRELHHAAAASDNTHHHVAAWKGLSLDSRYAQ